MRRILAKSPTHSSRLRQVRSRLPIYLLLAGLWVSDTEVCWSQAWLPPRGEGTVSLAYLYSNVHNHLGGSGNEVKVGRIYTHGLTALTDFGLTNKIAVSTSIPYVSSMYRGHNAHNPSTLTFPNTTDVLDTGAYHGALQDFGFAFRYKLKSEPFSITPFVGASIPTHDYTFFAHSAVGENIRQLNMGVNIGAQLKPLLPNAYFQVRYAYVMREKIEVEGLSYGSNQSLTRSEFGYFLTPRLTLKGIGILQISHGGLNIEDFKVRTNELFYHHDQVQRINFLELGGGFDIAINKSVDVFASILTTAWGHNGHALRQGLVVGINWYFKTSRARSDPAEQTASVCPVWCANCPRQYCSKRDVRLPSSFANGMAPSGR